jgi:hypothetical protein
VPTSTRDFKPREYYEMRYWEHALRDSEPGCKAPPPGCNLLYCEHLKRSIYLLFSYLSFLLFNPPVIYLPLPSSCNPSSLAFPLQEASHKRRGSVEQLKGIVSLYAFDYGILSNPNGTQCKLPCRSSRPVFGLCINGLSYEPWYYTALLNHAVAEE